MGRNKSGWIGFDLDKTLAYYNGVFVSHKLIGEPIPAMIAVLKRHLASGHTCKIFTARADETYPDHDEVITIIQDWTEKHVGKRLEVTNRKDRHMWLLYDDRAVQVEPNTGRIIKDGIPTENLNNYLREVE